jgi:hypothetical protein
MHGYDEVPVDRALHFMTDEWIEDGNVCSQTVIDLRDALKEALSKLKEKTNE